MKQAVFWTCLDADGFLGLDTRCDNCVYLLMMKGHPQDWEWDLMALGRSSEI